MTIVRHDRAGNLFFADLAVVFDPAILCSESTMKTKTIKIAVRTQTELRKQTPSALFRAALYRSGAGIHADNDGRYSKRNRAQNRRDERRALQNGPESD